jgi:hypothetical protein
MPPGTVGANRLADPNLDLWTSPTNLTNWTETPTGTSTVNQESVVIPPGATYAARLDIDGLNSACNINQTVTVGANSWIEVSCWVRTSALGKTGLLTSDGSPDSYSTSLNPGTTYTQYKWIFRSTKASPYFTFHRSSASDASIYYAKLSVAVLNPANYFAIRNYGQQTGFTSSLSILSSSLSGIIARYSDPNNYLHAYIWRQNTTKILLDAVIGGVPTNLIPATAITYTQWKNIQIKFPAANTAQLWYGATGAEAQIGADQDVSALPAGNYAGLAGFNSGDGFKNASPLN